MGVANKVINILVLVVAIAAVALGFLLFQKRDQLSESNKIMAESIAANAKKMDSSAAISADSMSPAKSVDEVGQTVEKFNSVAKTAMGQRDEMAKALAKSALEVGLVPAGKKASPADVISNKYKPAAIANVVASKAKRDRQFVKGVKELGTIFKDPVSDEVLAEDDALIRIYEEYVANTALKTAQQTEYLAVLNTLMASMKITAAKMDGNNFSVGLAQNKAAAVSFVKKAIDAMKKAEEYKKELDKYKSSLSGDQSDVVKAFTQVKKLEQERDLLKAENIRLRKIIDPTDSGEGLMSKEKAVADFPFLRRITAKVTYVNKDLGFVILDVGSRVKIRMNEKDKKEILADLPADGILSCASGIDDPEEVVYTGRIQICSIRDSQTIANILPSNGSIPNVGDSVIFTENDLDEMRMIREAKIEKTAAERANAMRAGQQTEGNANEEEGIIIEEE